MKVITILRERVVDFSNKTQLHGFLFVTLAGQKVTTILWLLLLLGSTGMLTHDVYNLVEQLLSQATAVSLSIERQPRILGTNPVICFDIDRDLLSYWVTNYISVGVGVNNSAIAENAFVARINGTNGWNCSIQTIVADDILVQAAYMLLASYMDYDLGNLKTYRLDSYYATMSGMLDLLESCLLESNVNLFDLARAVSVSLYGLLYNSMGYVFYDNSATGHDYNCAYGSNCPMNVSQAQWLGPTVLRRQYDAFCHTLPSLTIFNSSDDALSIFGSIYYLYPWAYTCWADVAECCTPIYPNGTNIDTNDFALLQVRLDLNGGESLMDPQSFHKSSGAPFYSTYSMSTIGISSVFNAFNTTAAPCSAELRSECAKRCMANAILASRGCWPLSLFTETGMMPGGGNETKACTRRYALSATSVGPSEYLWQSCLDGCTPPCEEAVFVARSSLLSIEQGYCWGTLEISPEAVLYSQFDEYLLVTPQSFLASLGGSIGLWLGGSIIAVLHFLTTPLVSCWRKCRGQRRQRVDLSTRGRTFFDFCAVSPIHGLTYIEHERQSCSQVVFWLAVVLAGVGLTVNDTISLVQLYNSEPTGIDVAIVRRPVDFSDLTLCVAPARQSMFAYIEQYVPQYLFPQGLNFTVAFNEFLQSINGSLSSSTMSSSSSLMSASSSSGSSSGTMSSSSSSMSASSSSGSSSSTMSSSSSSMSASSSSGSSGSSSSTMSSSSSSMSASSSSGSSSAFLASSTSASASSTTMSSSSSSMPSASSTTAPAAGRKRRSPPTVEAQLLYDSLAGMNERLFRLFYLYLKSISDFDTGSYLWDSAANGWYMNGEWSYGEFDDIFNQIEQWITANGLDVALVARQIALNYCNAFGIQSTMTLYDELTGLFVTQPTASFCTPENVLLMSNKAGVTVISGYGDNTDRLCYRLGSIANFTTSRDQLQLVYTSSPWYQLSFSYEFDIDLRPAAGGLDAQYIDGYSRTARTTASFGDEFVLLNRSSSVCSLQSRFACTKQCHVQSIETSRSCSSLMYAVDPTMTSSLPTCTSRLSVTETQNIVKSGNFTADLAWQDCARACNVECTTTVYSTTHTSSYNSANNPIVVRQRNLPFLQFTETLTMDWQSVLWSFGGSLGLWLGGSVMALVHIPLFILITICTLCCGKKNVVATGPAIVQEKAYTAAGPLIVQEKAQILIPESPEEAKVLQAFAYGRRHDGTRF